MDAMSRWKQSLAALEAVNRDLRAIHNRITARRIADPTRWELKQAEERKEKVLADLDATAKALGIVRLAPRPRRATVKLQEAG